MISDLTLTAIKAESIKAYAKHGSKTPMNSNMPNVERLAILVEEIGEVAKCLTYDQDLDNLECELIQVAAVAAMWIEGLQHNEEG